MSSAVVKLKVTSKGKPKRRETAEPRKTAAALKGEQKPRPKALSDFDIMSRLQWRPGRCRLLD